MPCENYREALIAAAGGEIVASHQLSAHLDVCAACRNAFREEQQLFAAMDISVRQSVNAKVPASLLPRVRARLEDHNVERFSWVKLGAVLAAACVVVSVAMWLRGPRSSRREAGPTLQATVQPPPTGATLAPATPAQTTTPASRFMRSQGDRRQVRTTDLGVMPQVLIPAGQREAVDAMLAAVRAGTVKPETLLGKGVERTPNGDLLPLRISEMEIEPLGAVNPEAGPAGETTRF